MLEKKYIFIINIAFFFQRTQVGWRPAIFWHLLGQFVWSVCAGDDSKQSWYYVSCYLFIVVDSSYENSDIPVSHSITGDDQAVSFTEDLLQVSIAVS